MAEGLLDHAGEVRRRELSNIEHSLKPISQYLDDGRVTDIFVDEAGIVSIKRFGEGKTACAECLTENNRLQICNQIAKWMGMTVNLDSYPVLEGTIPGHEARITGIYPPWTSSITIAIRKPPKKIFTLEEYVTTKRLLPDNYSIICRYIKERKNIIVSGGTNSGKTTFINACLEYMARISPDERFYIVQDNAELKINAQFKTLVTIRKEQATRAVQLALRWSPDRIIFGEVRDGNVAAELLDAWNTGHPGGITSIHADSSTSTITRLRSLLRQKYAGELPDIKEVVDLIVHLRQDRNVGVYVDDVLETSNSPVLEKLDLGLADRGLDKAI